MLRSLSPCLLLCACGGPDIPATYNPTAITSTDATLAAEAAGHWHTATGGLVTLTATDGEADIYLAQANLPDRRWGLASRHDGGPWLVEIDPREMPYSELRAAKLTTLIHEFGHVLGLDHGPGVMAPESMLQCVDAESARRLCEELGCDGVGTCP